MRFRKGWIGFILAGLLALPQTATFNAEELTCNEDISLESSLSELEYVGDGETINSDVYVTKSDSWSGKTINGNVYVYEGASLTLYGTTTINGNLYVLGMVYANGPLKVTGTLKCLYCSLDPGMVSSSNGHVYVMSDSDLGALDHTNTWISEMPGAAISYVPTATPKPTSTPRPTATPIPSQEIVNGDVYVTRSESWSGRTVNGNVYIYEGASLSLYGTTTINGNLYVLGMLYSMGPTRIVGSLKCLYCSLDPGAVTSDHGHAYFLSDTSIEQLDHTNSWFSEMPPDPRITATPTPRPTSTPIPIETATPTPRPTVTPIPYETVTPTPIYTETPTPTPIYTDTPTPMPTHAPVVPNIRETTVNGLDRPLELTPNTLYDFEVIGAGTKNVEPGIGDVRWLPVYWKTSLAEDDKQYSNWKIGSSEGITYSGDLPIYIFLKEQTYRDGNWFDTGHVDYIITFVKSAGYTPSPTPSPEPTETVSPTLTPTPQQREPYVPSINECRVTGLEEPKVFSEGAYYPINPVGVSAESLFRTLVVGDGKWMPEFWSFDQGGYERSEQWMLGDERGINAGTFEFYVWFRLFKWDGTFWRRTDDLRPIEVKYTSLPEEQETPIPTPTATPIPTATPTPTATPAPTATPTIKPVETREAPVITGFYNSVRGADLRWSKCDGCIGYCVYRKRAADGIKMVTYINDPNITQCYDTDIQTDCWGRVYVYYVSAVYSNGYEPESNQVTLQRLAPMRFTSYKNNTEASVDLSWACTVNANKALGYEVQYATSKTDLFNRTGSFKKVSINGRNNLNLRISGFTKGQTYYFRIRCYVNYTHSVTKKTTKTWSQYSDVISAKITK